VSDEGDHLFGRMLADAQALARMPQQAQLDGEAQSVATAPFGPNERQIFGAQHVMLRHPGGIRWDAKQTGALFRSEEGSAGHRDLQVIAGGPFINRLPLAEF
jgi:hypothetical protein